MTLALVTFAAGVLVGFACCHLDRKRSERPTRAKGSPSVIRPAPLGGRHRGNLKAVR